MSPPLPTSRPVKRTVTETFDDFVDRLNKVKHRPGGASAECPIHDDNNPSLSVSEGEDGRILLYCHAGCSTSDIVKAMGRTMGDLMGEAVKDDDRPQEIVASYPYVDEDNTAVRYCIDRYGPRKDFKVRPKGVKSHDRVLYNLHWVK